MSEYRDSLVCSVLVCPEFVFLSGREGGGEVGEGGLVGEAQN